MGKNKIEISFKNLIVLMLLCVVSGCGIGIYFMLDSSFWVGFYLGRIDIWNILKSLIGI